MVMTYTNKHGRKPGRGLRPWLLLPKILAVCVFMGSLTAAAAVWFSRISSVLDPADPRQRWTIDLVGWIILQVSVPSLLVALVLGAALVWAHGRVMLRLRWLRVKLVFLAVLIPASHVFLASRLELVRAAALLRRADPEAARQFGVGLIVAIAGFALVIVMGRLKPNLRQNWARDFGQAPTTTTPSAPLPREATDQERSR